MNIVLLSGGSGKRLWPLSNAIRSKQFIKIFKTPGGGYESMVQRVYRQIRSVDSEAKIIIATSKTQVSAIHNQLGLNVCVCVEPCRRDTFAAIALTAVTLHERKVLSENETIAVCPVDPYVDIEYFQALETMCERAEHSAANLVLMGVEPTYPSENYGYIIPESPDAFSTVSMFREKPDTETARDYIAQGALWNGGVFAFRLGYMLQRAHELIDFTDSADLAAKYETLPKISFDYAVVEQEKQIEVMRFAGQWKDLGTWNTLTEAMDGEHIGKTMTDDTCENIHIINELNIPVLCMGLKNAIIAASPDGIMVSDSARSSYIKPYVDTITQQIMFAEKSWGYYQVIDIEENNMTVKIMLNPDKQMNYHSHELRDEVWTVVSGEGKAVLNGQERAVKAGDVIHIPCGCRHTLLARTALHVIEVQMGKNICLHDKQNHTIEI